MDVKRCGCGAAVTPAEDACFRGRCEDCYAGAQPLGGHLRIGLGGGGRAGEFPPQTDRRAAVGGSTPPPPRASARGYGPADVPQPGANRGSRTPEAKARMSVKLKDYWKRRKAGGVG